MMRSRRSISSIQEWRRLQAKWEAWANTQITGYGCLIGYDLPGGAMLMEFTAGAWDQNPIADGHGGLFYQETWDLTIDQATGIYAPYKGGHNHMVDRYDSLGGGTPLEATQTPGLNQ